APETPALADLGNLEVPQLNAQAKPVTQTAPETPVLADLGISQATAKPTPVVNKSSALIDELDGIAMAPKTENKEDEEDEYMSRVVNTRLEDYDDDDDDDDYDDDDYYDDDDDEEYHGSSYAPSDDDDDDIEDSEEYESQETMKISKKENQLSVEDIRAATAAMNAAAGNLQAATAAMNAAAKASTPVPEFGLPNLSNFDNLGISNVPELDIPNVPDLGIPNVPELNIPSVPNLSDMPDIPTMSSNPFEADANADIPEVPTLAEVPTLSNDDMNLSAPPMGSMPYQPVYQQPVYPQQPVYTPPVYPQPPQYIQPQQPVYPQSVPAPAVHAPQQPQQPVSQGVRVSTIGQKTVVPDAVRNAIAKTAAQSSENIFDQQGKKVEVATDITSALNQMGADTSYLNKPKQEENEPVIQGYKEWRPKEDKKLANFKKGLNKKF
ncbi:MAG: hypothetical protein K2G88_08325, partial [Oscillospiraceae bacterium]|nr:hypothetical protein [Oscillospiraceae bacterium]